MSPKIFYSNYKKKLINGIFYISSSKTIFYKELTNIKQTLVNHNFPKNAWSCRWSSFLGASGTKLWTRLRRVDIAGARHFNNNKHPPTANARQASVDNERQACDCIHLTPNYVRIWHKAVSLWEPRTGQNPCEVKAKILCPVSIPQLRHLRPQAINLLLQAGIVWGPTHRSQGIVNLSYSAQMPDDPDRVRTLRQRIGLNKTNWCCREMVLFCHRYSIHS